MRKIEKMLENMIGKAVDRTIIKMQVAGKKKTLKEDLESNSEQTEDLSWKDKLYYEQRALAGIEERPTQLIKVNKGLLTDAQIYERRLALDEPFDGIEILEAKWSAKFINDLPDSAFALIKDGGKKDETGRTTPRSLRYLPYKGADGKFDLPHLRNALARLPQSDLSDDEKKKAESTLKKAAKEAGIGEYRKENLTLSQAWERRMALGETEMVAASNIVGDGDFRDSYEDLRKKLGDALRNTGKYSEYPAILGTFEDRVIISVYDSKEGTARYFEISYAWNGEKVEITGERELEKKVEFSVKEWIEYLRKELNPPKG